MAEEKPIDAVEPGATLMSRWLSSLFAQLELDGSTREERDIVVSVAYLSTYKVYVVPRHVDDRATIDRLTDNI